MKKLIADIEEQLMLNGSVGIVVAKKNEATTNVLDLDPWDPNLTDEQKVAILKKCKEDPFYLLTAVKGYKLQAVSTGIGFVLTTEKSEMTVRAFIGRSKEAWNEIQKSARKVTSRLVERNYECGLSKHNSSPLDRLEQSRLAKRKLLKRSSAKKSQ